MLKMIAGLLTLLLVGCSDTAQSESQQPAVPTAGEVTEMIFVTEDGLEIHGWLQASSENIAPLLVMLPMRRATHVSYDPIIAAIRSRQLVPDSTALPHPHLLALDLRGHGKSVVRNSDTVEVMTMAQEEYLAMPRDVAIVVDSMVHLLGDRVDTSRIFVVGASIGANSAIMATQHTDVIDKVVLLSPGSDYLGLKPAEAFREFDGEVLIVATRGDEYSFASSQQLLGEKMSGWLMKAYGGDTHGTDIPAATEQAMTDILNWLFGESK